MLEGLVIWRVLNLEGLADLLGTEPDRFAGARGPIWDSGSFLPLFIIVMLSRIDSKFTSKYARPGFPTTRLAVGKPKHNFQQVDSLHESRLKSFGGFGQMRSSKDIPSVRKNPDVRIVEELISRLEIFSKNLWLIRPKLSLAQEI